MLASVELGAVFRGVGVCLTAALAFFMPSIHPSAWKGYSPKFAGTEFSEVAASLTPSLQ